MTAQPNDGDLSHYRCFLSDLEDFIVGNAGKPYISPTPNWNRHWDKVIEDLTRVTARRASTYLKQASHGISPYRGQGYLCFLSGESIPNSSLAESGLLQLGQIEDMEVPVSDMADHWDREGEAISIIEFVVEYEE
jgi:hypothetical protein